MKTAVLEKMPDLFWELVRKNNLANFFYENEQVKKDEIEIAIIRTKTICYDEWFSYYPRLKFIIRAGTGIENIDIKTALKKNIRVFNTPEANAKAACEQTIAFMLGLIKKQRKFTNSVINNRWKDGIDYNHEISDIKLLVVGVGRIGSMVSTIMQHLGAAVKGVDPYLTNKEWQYKSVDSVSYNDGIKWANMISFHCPLTQETEDYFDTSVLNRLKNPIWLINTSRGGVVSLEAVKLGLANNLLMGVALDVFPEEPCKVFDFMKDERVILSPHVGAYTSKAKARMAKETFLLWQQLVNEEDKSIA